MPFLGWPYIQGESAWGPNTGLYEFCEMDYYITPYIAEFISVLTNVGYISLGIRGIRNNHRNSNDQVVNLCYGNLIFVGVGSALYHMNLKYFTQMIDEASMLYATAAILYGSLSITMGSTSRKSLATFLTGVIIAASIAHFIICDVQTFRRTFLVMLFTNLGQCIWLFSSRVPDVGVKRAARCLALYGTCSFILGFSLWDIDNKFCAQLTHARALVGMPLGFLTELHGWWHLWTGVGTYHFIVFIEYLRTYIKAVEEAEESSSSSSSKRKRKRKPPPTLVWPSRFSLPYVTDLRAATTK
ncbi:uncharacterized protein L3040_006925 [Drepanopeziza brunnea f. sp. 'multigermtubi']|uniref:Alkaline ceramidase family protein n=1 Tax=Marssonina brunnea f. sp. multigermtubi (strain MB_m1) TaxID=1072389 RepID=K1WKK3_MARBU|nr:alkaline ceramidase family protein [Drepanopeziza brunnea f. sp. 'multigermtubi' MB_m1]EKD12772.1 alkaline ceramidase family protein [Drepanopeziza brunnea f. sp. 'multigermtubi' MB_m1]KAJ5038054.1 hypothetical protein L3040_006925 [Drepanopeziza brunnea f. sp. 'multigermtubi']